MPHPLLSQALQEAYASAQTEVEVLDVVELRYGTTSLVLCKGNSSRYVVIDGASVLARPYPFKMQGRPHVDASGGATMTLSVENVQGQVFTFIQAARQANTPVYLFVRTYLVSPSGAVSEQQNARDIKLTVTEAKATLEGVSITAAASNVVNKAFPNVRYTYTAFPGLRG